MSEVIHHHCAVLGKPIEHSLSPVLHNTAYHALGLDDWLYTKVEVGEADLDAFLRALDPSWAGLSLTMPLKRTIQPYGVPNDRWSRMLHVANTAIFSWRDSSQKPDIKLYNTDVEGIERAFTHSWETGGTVTNSTSSGDSNQSGKSSKGARAVILGNGNTALSSLAACTELHVPGIGSIGQVTVCARHKHENDPMGQLAQSAYGQKIDYVQVPLIEAPEMLHQADIVINTIPAHGADETAQRLQDSLMKHQHNLSGRTLLDVVYDPRPTKLMQVWRNAGGTAIGGEEMLLYQAIAQVKLMTAGANIIRTADFEEAMRSALQEAL
ncbi:shikimate dehydrogenase [Bifidobacterium sp. ESL0682]|uniref:shikimate dehydrogenase family protein n=1 Tax=Bifidobacterium sp. ESL0682 TaxID=2983212 RepID=UPI0023F84C16|nr:shikimate dehydrogenase [Bifidobacterium sp. ESL0682]WEV42620.1 shikimate dehydrogenase [Bifidobacterium sp. ESL0682]